MENNFTFENKDDINILLIKPYDITNLDWSCDDYTQQIIDLPYYDIIKTNPDKFFFDINNYLDIQKHQVFSFEIITEIIAEEPYYIYELLYIKKNNETDNIGTDNIGTDNIGTDNIGTDNIGTDNKLEFNGIASLLNTTSEIKIYGPVILLKTYLKSLSKEMILENVTQHDIKLILDNRIKTKIVTFDDEWKEEIVIGNLETFANKFFDDNTYKKIEMAFLLHNINIWYDTIDNSKLRICGKLIDKPIYKCIIFTMKSDEYRGNIYLNEVTKIIELSNILEYPFKSDEKWTFDEIDDYGRNIIKNKYRVLDHAYNDLIINKI